MDFSVRAEIWEAGHLLHLLFSPEFSQLVFSGSIMLLIGTSCCETTQASRPGQHGGFDQQFPNNYTWYYMKRVLLAF